MREITGMLIKAGVSRFHLIKLEDKLETYQKIVDGYIETYPIREDILVVLNEEGKLKGLKPNLLVMEGDDILDIIVGDVCLVSYDEEGNFDSLNDEQVKWIRENAIGVITDYGFMTAIGIG